MTTSPALLCTAAIFLSFAPSLLAPAPPGKAAWPACTAAGWQPADMHLGLCTLQSSLARPPFLCSKPVWAALARGATDELAQQQFAALSDGEALGILKVPSRWRGIVVWWRERKQLNPACGSADGSYRPPVLPAGCRPGCLTAFPNPAAAALHLTPTPPPPLGSGPQAGRGAPAPAAEAHRHAGHPQPWRRIHCSLPAGRAACR